MNRKLFAFDLDGTLLQQDETINKNTLEAIHHASEEGHLVVVNTGRGPHKLWMNRLLPNHSDFDYLIFNNGSMYTNTHKKENVYFGHIDLDIVFKVIQRIKQSFEVYFVLQTDQDVYCLKMWDEQNPPKWLGDEEVADIMKHYNNVVDESTLLKMVNVDKAIQISLMSVTDNLHYIQPFIKEFIGNELTVHKAGVNFIDITINNVNKFNALEIVRKQENIEFENVYVFGDAGNDYEMLKGYKNSYAMGNASQNIKDVASEVIGLNSSDTIGKKIIDVLKKEN